MQAWILHTSSILSMFRDEEKRIEKQSTNTMTDIYLLPVVFVVPSWLAVIPSVVLHSSSSFSSFSSWLFTASWPGSKDWLKPLSLSLQLCSEELPTIGEALHREEGLFVGLMTTVFPCDTGVRGVEVGGAPFLPKEACPLITVLPGLFCTWLTPGPVGELCVLTGGWGLQSGDGLEVLGVELDCAFFFPLDVRIGTGGGGDTGAAEEGWGEVGWKTPDMKTGPSLCGEAGGVWKLSPRDPGEKSKQLKSIKSYMYDSQLIKYWRFGSVFQAHHRPKASVHYVLGFPDRQIPKSWEWDPEINFM